MPASLIRSRAMITHAVDRHACNEIADGALVQEDGVITAIGTYADLSRRHPNLPVIGTGGEIVVPGFVNGHHHVGLTPVQLGLTGHAARIVVCDAHGHARRKFLSRHAPFGL
jgi:5-methylthioadenosine/S-adenosylhomocysteine deaminase